jgi:hypothetical protein
MNQLLGPGWGAEGAVGPGFQPGIKIATVCRVYGLDSQLLRPEAPVVFATGDRRRALLVNFRLHARGERLGPPRR